MVKRLGEVDVVRQAMYGILPWSMLQAHYTLAFLQCFVCTVLCTLHVCGHL